MLWVLIQILLSVAVILLLPTFWLDYTYGQPFWELEAARWRFLLVIAAAHFVGAVALAWRVRSATASLVSIGVAALASTGTVFVASLLLSAPISRIMLAAATALSWLLFLVAFRFRRGDFAKSIVLAAAVVAAVGAHASARTYMRSAADLNAAERSVPTSLYSLRVRSYREAVPRPLQTGGAMARLWDDYLLATGDGDLVRFREDQTKGALSVAPLALRIPINVADFRKAVADLKLQAEWFRVADIHTVLHSDRVSLFATHHYWHADRQCFTMRLSVAELDKGALSASSALPTWTTLFETTPCLPITLPNGRAFFAGLQIAGRIAMLDANTLLFTTGDHEFDGITAPLSLPQDMTASYGKTLTIDLTTRKVDFFTVGHRNPQGLYVDPTGAVYETEHGPQGGDELNRLERGVNYGWPLVTYGVNYQTHEWPPNPRQGRHDGYRQPLFAWVPSIGASSVIGVTSQQFGLWRGDLLVGGLRDRAIWRVRLAEGRVVLTEPFVVGVRVRDLIEGHGGELLVWGEQAEQNTGYDILFVSVDAAQVSGASIYGVKCSGCHAIENGTTHGIGPDLFGAAGSRVASRDGFGYSQALRDLGGSWTDQRLDAFLADSAAFAPGNAMRAAGIQDAEERRKIIEYLKTRR